MGEKEKIQLAMTQQPEDDAFYAGVESDPRLHRQVLLQEIAAERDPARRAIMQKQLTAADVTGDTPRTPEPVGAPSTNAPTQAPLEGTDFSDFLDKRIGHAAAGAQGDLTLDDFLSSRPAAAAAKPAQSPMRRLGDVGIAAVKSAIGVPEAVVGAADLVTGGEAGKLLENKEGSFGFRPRQAREFLDEFKSDAQKAADAEVAQAKGLIDTARAVVGNPSTAVMAAIESLGSIGLGGVAARGALAIAPKIGPVIAGGASEGLVSAGQNAEQVRQESPTGTLTGTQSAVLAASGAVTGVLGVFGGKLAERLGVPDINTLAAGGYGPEATKNFVKRFLSGAVSEGLFEELPQSVQEQMAQNYAQQKPLDEGVDQAAVLGLFTGGLFGGGVAAAHRGAPTPPPRPSPEKAMSDLENAENVDSAIAAAVDLAESYDTLRTANDQYLDPGLLAAAGQDATGDAVLSKEGQRQALDSQAKALEQAQSAGFEAERTAALEQADVAQERAVGTPQPGAAESYEDLTPMDLRQARARLLVLRDMAKNDLVEDPNRLVIVRHPQQAGAFAVQRLPEPGAGAPAAEQPLAQTPTSVQSQIESAAMVGKEANRRLEDRERQEMISRATRSIEQRGGVASPEEARILREANMGRPYDRIDPGLSTTEPTLTTDQKLTRATGIQLTGQPRETMTYGTDTQLEQEKAAQREGQAAYTPKPKVGPETEAKAPAQPPSLLSVVDAMQRAPFRRSADQRAVINAARQHYTAQQIETLQRGADNPASLSAEERVWYKGEAQRDQVIPNVTLSTERASAMPGDEIRVTHNNTAHSLRVEDSSKLRGYPLLREIARMAGHRVVAFSSETLKAGGFVSNDANTLYLNINSRMNPLVEFGHEFGHLIEKNHPEIATAMKEAVAKNTDLDAARRDYTNAKEGEATPAETREGEALSEATSDLLGNRMSEPEFWTDVFNRVEQQHGAPKARSIIQRLVAALNAALNKLLAAVQGSKYRADSFVKDIGAVKSALAKGMADYLVARRDTAVATNAIDQAAHAAATSPKNDLPQPTQAQKDAGNYKKGHLNFQGLDITIENPRGSKRSGVDPDGKPWSVEMEHHYGYVKGTVGKDKDHIDVFIGKSPASKMVYVVDQVNKDGGFDEHKVMFGFNSIAEARKGYADNYTAGWKVGPMTAVPMADFKAWLANGNTTKPYSKGTIDGSKSTREAGEPVVASPDRQGAEEQRRGPEPVSATGIHYSKSQRSSLNGVFYGSGLKGAEAERLAATTDDRLKRRVYFYIDEGKGVIPEAGVGGFAHEVNLDNLYDAATKKITGADLNGFESAVLDAGYNGYLIGTGNTLTGQKVAVVLGDATLPAKYIGNGPKKTVGEMVKTAPVQGSGTSTAMRNMFRNNPEAAFKEPGWAVITATREAEGAADSEANQRANQGLEDELRARNIAFDPVKGSYQGVDQGKNYLVYASESVAKELGEKYGQESVLTNKGLVYTDGTGRLVPAVHANDIVGEKAKNEDFYSELPNGTAFSLGLNFDALEESVTASPERQSLEDFYKENGENIDATFEADVEGTSDNASGESAASLEAQSRVAQEKAKGQTRLLINRDGTVRPLLGVDSVDQRAGAGQMIVQRNVGRNAWTVLEEGEGVTKSMRQRALSLAASYTPSVDVDSYSNMRGVEIDKNVLLVGLTKKQAQVSLIPDLYSDFKLEDRPRFKTVSEVAAYLEARTLKAIKEPITESTNANRKFLSTIIAAEANAAFTKEGHAGQWYKQSITDALASAAELHPEIATDDDQRFLFQFALALTSNGQSVPENVKLAFEVYEGYKRDGKFPTWINGGGKNARAIVDSLAYAGDMIENIRLDNFRKAMLTTWKARDLQEWSGRSVEAFLDDEVYGGSIFGPKIGGAFLQNLNGNFDALTIDRWMMRTWGRLTGRLIDPRAENGVIDTPGSAGRRAFIRDTMSEALDRMKAVGNTIDMADLQAAIWYPEKELYALLGRNNAKAAPTDYATEVRKFIEARRRGDDGGAQPRGGRDATEVGQRDAGVQDTLFSSERDTKERVFTAVMERERARAGLLAGFGAEDLAVNGPREPMSSADSKLKGLLEKARITYSKLQRLQPKDQDTLESLGYVTRRGKLTPEGDAKLGEFRLRDRQDAARYVYQKSASSFSTTRVYGDLTPEQERSLKNVGAFPTELTLKDRLAGLRQDMGLRVTQGLVDQFAAIKHIDPKAYMLARLSKGSDGTMEAAMLYGKPFLRDGVADVDVADGGFAKTLAKLNGEQDRFLWWVAAQRAERLKAEGKEFLFTEDDISNLKELDQGAFADGTNRKTVYAEALRELNAFNDAVLALAEESGLVDPEARKLFKDHPYVPFYRVMNDGEAQGPRFSSGLVNQKAWKKLKGSDKQLNADLLSNMLQNWAHLFSASAKNRAAVASLRAATAMDVAYPVEEWSGMKGLVAVMEDGKTVHYKIEDPYLMEAVTALNYVTPEFFKPFSTMKRWLTIGVTASPTFKIRNLIRDSLSAIGQAELSPNVFGNVAKGWAATKEGSQTLASMTAGGGMIHFGSSHEGDRSHRVRKMIDKAGGKVLDTQGWKALSGQLEKLWDAYSELGDRGENVNRAALYEQLRAKGIGHAEANFMARDLLDFSMAGRWPVVRFLTETVPFLNARLQGLYKLGRAAKENPRRLGAMVGAVSLASLALMLGYEDDEDWKKREDWDRDTYWWFKIGDVAYRIPKPFEIGAIGTLAERTWEMGFNEEMTGKRFRERLSNAVFQTFAMDPTPQIVKPLLDVWANKDSFTQRPIESAALQSLRPEDRFDERTTTVAKWLGMLGLPDPAQLAKGQYSALSPKQVDFLLRGYFGSLGATAAVAMDWGLRPLTGAGERPDVKLKDVFLVGAFRETLPTNSSRYVTQLYNNATAVEQAYSSYQAALKSGDVEKAREILGDEGAKIKLYPTVEAIKRGESQLNARIKQVEASKTLSGETKRRLIDMLNQQKNALAERLPPVQ